jgi:hypothetical protein
VKNDRATDKVIGRIGELFLEFKKMFCCFFNFRKKTLDKEPFVDEIFAECSLPSVTLGKGFAECKIAFAECLRHSAKNAIPVVKIQKYIVLKAKMSLADGPALRPDGPRWRRGRSARAESVRVPSFSRNLLPKTAGLTRETVGNGSRPPPLYR